MRTRLLRALDPTDIASAAGKAIVLAGLALCCIGVSFSTKATAQGIGIDPIVTDRPGQSISPYSGVSSPSPYSTNASPSPYSQAPSPSPYSGGAEPVALYWWAKRFNLSKHVKGACRSELSSGSKSTGPTGPKLQSIRTWSIHYEGPYGALRSESRIRQTRYC
jgi:hypothetical protein